jgi:hypothetical protein
MWKCCELCVVSCMFSYIQGPFAKFVDTPYYSELELCGGVVMVSLDKQCSSYNTPPSSRKCAADRWSLWNFLPQSSLFMAGKGQKSHGARCGLYGRCSTGLPPISTFSKLNTEFNWDLTPWDF